MIITQKPDALSLSGNLKNIILDEATGQVAFTLSVGSSEILSGIYTPDESGRIIIDIRRYVEEQLSFNLTYGTEPWQQTMLARTFSFTAGELDAQTFTAIRTGIDNPGETAANWLRANFLTWQPTVKHVTYSTPEFLTYYAASACRLMMKVYYPDGTSSTLDPIALSAGAWTIPVFYAAIAARLGLSTQEELEAEEQLPGAYDVWIADNSGNVLTYIQRYIAGEMRESEQWILFENSLGGLDCFRAYGQGTLEAEHEHQLAELDNMTEEYRTDTTRKQRRSSGWLNRQERRWLLDFFPSRRRWICENGSFRPIVLTEDSVSYSIDNMPAEFQFSFRYATTHSYLNIPRLSEPQTVLNIKAPDLRSFSVPPRLVEFPRLTLLEGALIPVQSPYSDVWSAVSLDDIIQSVTPAAITWDTLPGKPSWIGADKPSYTYGDGYLTGFASASSVQSLLSLINDLFTKESDGAGGYRIKANYGLYTDSFLSAGGLGHGGQSTGGINTIKFGEKSYTVAEESDTFITIPMSGTNSITAHLGIDALGVRVTALENRPQGGVTSFNGRTGAITLIADDVPALQIFKISGLQSALDAKQPLITDANKLDYSLISGTPTALKNPYALTFGSKTYDGSSAKEITASDLGALTAHQTIYDLIIQKNGTKVGNTYNPATGAQTINITDVASADALEDLKIWIESLFTKESDGAGGYRIKANFGLYSDSFISAGGIGSGGGGGGGIVSIYLDGVRQPDTDGRVDLNLSSYALKSWVTSQGYITAAALTGYATQNWVTSQGYTTNTGTVTSVAVKMNGSVKGTITTSGTIDLGYVTGQQQWTSAPTDSTYGASGDIGVYGALSDSDLIERYYLLSKIQNISTQYTKYEWKQIATVDDIPTNNNQLTNGAGYITSSGSCAYASSAGSVAWANVSGKPTKLSDLTDDVVSGHYLPLSGGTITGTLTVNAATTVNRLVISSTSLAKHIEFSHSTNYITIPTDSTLSFSVNTASGGSTIVRLTAAGNLGIGTITPSYKLDVAGDIHTSASLRIGSIELKNDNGLLHIVGGMYADGQISAGGIGSGGGGGGGIVSIYLDSVRQPETDGRVDLNLSSYALKSWVTSQGYLTSVPNGSITVEKLHQTVYDGINLGVTAYNWGNHANAGYLKSITSSMVTSALGYTPYNAANIGSASVAYASNSNGLSYYGQVTTKAAIDAFHEAARFKVCTWNGTAEGMGTSYPGTANGIIIDGGWTSASYGFQLAIDDDPNWFIALRQMGSGTWSAWKRIPMADGAGASGTWGIDITGNAGYATSAGNADTLDGNHASAFATATQGSNADTAYGWGNHADAGYTKNTGTVTSVAIKMNGSVMGTITTSGTIDLGYVTGQQQWTSAPAESTYGAPGDIGVYGALSGSDLIERHYLLSKIQNISTQYTKYEWKQIATLDDIPSLSGYATTSWVSNNFSPIGHTHSQYLTSVGWANLTSNANSLEEGTSDVTDNTEILTSYASNNGFSDPNAVGKVYKRDAVHIYNYVKSKLGLGSAAYTDSSAYATAGHTHDGRYLRWAGNAADVTAMGWGTLTAANGYTILSHASSSDGGDVGLCYKGGQIFMQLDGYFYQREGAYRCLDTADSGGNSLITSGNIGSQLVYGVLTNNASQGGTACYDASPGLHFYRYNGDDNTIGGGDGWILQWSWNQGSVGGQIYLDDNPSKIISIRGYQSGFTSWTRIALTSDIPTNNNQLTNGAGYITASALSGYALQQWVNENYLRMAGGTADPASSLDINQPAVYAKMVTGSSGAEFGYFLLTKMTGYSGGTAREWKKIATINDIPTNNNQLTNGAGYITSSGSCAYASSAGNADTVDGEHSSAFAHIGAHNNLTASGNEFTFASSGFSGQIYLNYRTAGGTNGNITDYIFSNGKGGSLVALSTLITGASQGATAYGWGNHASAGYAYASQLGSYLALSGGTMTGQFNTRNNAVGINFRGYSSSVWDSWCAHETTGNEALVFGTQNANTAIMFVNGESYGNVSSSRFQSLTPGLSIVNNSVLIGHGYTSSPSYKLDVNGSFNATSGYIGGNAIATQSWVTSQGYTKNTGTVTSVAVKINGSVKGTVTSSGTIDLGVGYTKVLNLSSTPTNTTSGEAGAFYTVTNDAEHMYLCLGQTGQYTYGWLKIKLDGIIS